MTPAVDSSVPPYGKLIGLVADKSLRGLHAKLGLKEDLYVVENGLLLAKHETVPLEKIVDDAQSKILRAYHPDILQAHGDKSAVKTNNEVTSAVGEAAALLRNPTELSKELNLPLSRPSNSLLDMTFTRVPEELRQILSICRQTPSTDGITDLCVELAADNGVRKGLLTNAPSVSREFVKYVATYMTQGPVRNASIPLESVKTLIIESPMKARAEIVQTVAKQICQDDREGLPQELDRLKLIAGLAVLVPPNHSTTKIFRSRIEGVKRYSRFQASIQEDQGQSTKAIVRLATVIRHLDAIPEVQDHVARELRGNWKNILEGKGSIEVIKSLVGLHKNLEVQQEINKKTRRFQFREIKNESRYVATYRGIVDQTVSHTWAKGTTDGIQNLLGIVQKYPEGFRHVKESWLSYLEKVNRGGPWAPKGYGNESGFAGTILRCVEIHELLEGTFPEIMKNVSKTEPYSNLKQNTVERYLRSELSLEHVDRMRASLDMDHDDYVTAVAKECASALKNARSVESLDKVFMWLYRSGDASSVVKHPTFANALNVVKQLGEFPYHSLFKTVILLKSSRPVPPFR